MNFNITKAQLTAAREAIKAALGESHLSPSWALDLFLRWVLLEPEPWHEPDWGRAWVQAAAMRRYPYPHERITKSVDQAVAFVEEVLPGWNIRIFSDCGAYFARVEHHDDEWKYFAGNDGGGEDRIEAWPLILLDAACRGCEYVLEKRDAA